MYCLDSFNDQFPFLPYLIILYFRLLSSMICNTSQAQSCQHVLIVFILRADSATTQDWEHGQKDRYDHLSFPGTIAVIRNTIGDFLF